jgi:hypothetical protein
VAWMLHCCNLGACHDLTCLLTTTPYSSCPQENKFWEDSFQVYERAVALFRYPHVRDIWAAYLRQFVERYGGRKLERARDLFEHALSMAPPEECRTLYLQYAQLEEQHGLARWVEGGACCAWRWWHLVCAGFCCSRLLLPGHGVVDSVRVMALASAVYLQVLLPVSAVSLCIKDVSSACSTMAPSAAHALRCGHHLASARRAVL